MLPRELLPQDLEQYIGKNDFNKNVILDRFKLDWPNYGIIFLTIPVDSTRVDLYRRGCEIIEKYTKEIKDFFRTIGFPVEDDRSIRFKYDYKSGIKYGVIIVYGFTNRVEKGVAIEA